MTLRTRVGTIAVTHLQWLMIGFVLPIVGGMVMYSLARQYDTSIAQVIDWSQPHLETSTSAITPQSPQIAPIQNQVVGDIIEYTVRRNDTLERIFRQLHLGLDDLATIRDLPDVRENLDAIKPGDLISFTHLDSVVNMLALRISESKKLTVTRDGNGFSSRVVETPLDISVQRLHGRIESSLFAAARAAGASSDLIMRLANDIFGWDIDFALEIQPGDTFAIVYEKKYRDGQYLSDGRILAAEFVNEGRIYRAVRFESADGQIADYFAPDGHSMRKQFLRAPLDFTHISSGFSLRRLHPILNTIRAHQGVDCAAPTGTAIKAAGDGRIDFVGTKGGYGKAIILAHGGAISTLYGHMSQFARNMRVGTHVKQGQVIGYVGSTGSATGPHLHYEYRVNGVHKNPRTVGLPDAQPIPFAYREEFARHCSALLMQIDQARSAQMAAVPESRRNSH